MALQLEFSAPTGSIYPEAYFRVVQVNCSWMNKRAKATILIYRNVAARLADKKQVGQMAYSFNGEEGDKFNKLFSMEIFNKKKTNPLQVVYEHIKVLPEFEGSKDV